MSDDPREKQVKLNERLHAAVVSGDLAAAEAAFEEGAEESQYKYSRTNWTKNEALSSNNVEMCRLLKKQGVKFDVLDDLYTQAKNGNRLVCQFLLEECSMWEMEKKKNTAPSLGCFIASMGEKWIFEMAMNISPDPYLLLTQLDNNWNSPLETAVKTKNIELCAYLLDKGAEPDVNAFIASTKFGIDIAKLFLNAGLSPDAVNLAGESALQAAVENENLDLARLLLDEGAHVDMSRNGSTALMHSTKNLDVTRLLIERGADVRKKNTEGENILLITIRRSPDNFLGVVNMIGEHPDLFTVKDGKGQNLLHLLSEKTLRLTTEIAISIVGNPLITGLIESPDSRGYTPLMAAAQGVGLGFTVALLDAGAKVDHVSLTGENAFSIAVARGNNQMCRLFLAAGADVNHLDAGGQTSLDKAIRSGKEDLYPLLIAEGGVCKAINLTQLPAHRRNSSVLQDSPLLAAIKTEDVDYLKLHLQRRPDPSPDEVKKALAFVRKSRKGDVCAYFNSWVAQRDIDKVLASAICLKIDK